MKTLRPRYNILSGNRLRMRYARTRAELAAELALFCLLGAACAALAALGALRLIWLAFAAGPRLALRCAAQPLAVLHEACDTVHLGYLYYRLASGYVRAHLRHSGSASLFVDLWVVLLAVSAARAHSAKQQS